MFFRQLAPRACFLIAVILAVVLLFDIQDVRANSLADKKIGIILMHGKGGTDKLVASLGSALQGAGALVITPLMPWSAARIYDKSYEEAMSEIDGYVAALRADGAQRIIIAGHSLGANAAMGYGARRSDVSGIVLLAYGHVPGKRGLAKKLSGSVEKARKMIDEGRGKEIAEFSDTGGANSTATGSANDILSWFDPAGPATIATNAPNVSPNIAVMCVDGQYDKWKRCDEILNLVPVHPKNAKATVNADHEGTPAASVEVVLNWLQGLD
ncbi:MAG: hypothetical protein O2817_12360 [Proteobacteria bacterium]|nr:hypothetical protein [Pseudomonadota bacterium]